MASLSWKNGQHLMQQHHRQTHSTDIVRMHDMVGHSGAVWGLAVDGNRVVSGGVDRTIKMWDLFSGRCLATLRGHESWVSSVSFSADRGCIVSGSWDGDMSCVGTRGRSSIRPPSSGRPDLGHSQIHGLEWDQARDHVCSRAPRRGRCASLTLSPSSWVHTVRGPHGCRYVSASGP